MDAGGAGYVWDFRMVGMDIMRWFKRLFRRRRPKHLDHPAFASDWHAPGAVLLFMEMGVWK